MANNYFVIKNGTYSPVYSGGTYYGDGSNLYNVIDILTRTNFNYHSGDTSIHFTKNSINLSDLSNTAHTHTIITGFKK